MKRPIPKALDAIADKVLAYRPKPKSKPARRRQRAKRKAERGGV
jgi:hypothetical protein